MAALYHLPWLRAQPWRSLLLSEWVYVDPPAGRGKAELPLVILPRTHLDAQGPGTRVSMWVSEE